MTSSPITFTWLDDFGEPSLMTSGICPMSVFDKFDWDSNVLGDDSDQLLDEIRIKTEPDDDPLSDKSSTDFGTLRSIFPDISDDITRINSRSSSSSSSNSSSNSNSNRNSNSNSNSSRGIDGVVSITSPHPSPLSPTLATSLFSDNDNCNSIVQLQSNSTVKEEPVEVNEEFDSLFTAMESCGSNPMVTSSFAILPDIKTENEDNGVVAASTFNLATPTPKLKSTTVSSIIRIPVQRNSNTMVNGTGAGRLKAVVVCPDRSKSIVCNVVRSTNKGIVIQKPIQRSWLNVCRNIHSEATKLPIKVNVITSKEANLTHGNLKDFLRAELYSYKEKSSVVKGPSMTLASSKIEAAAPSRPETPQSMVGSDEEFFPFSSPCKNRNAKCFGDSFQDDYLKSCLLEEENLCSDSLKCFPPAEVTGQIQSVIPDIFKYTPNSSPTSNNLHSDSMLDSFYTKMHVTSNSNSQNLFHNKDAANVDHDYGFICRTPNPKSISSLAPIFSVDNLGIQTPSASEPPTDSDDDDTIFNDLTLLNKDMDCSELDREQREYFENLKHQLKLAELVDDTYSQKQSRSSKNLSLCVKERKLAGRNHRKRKLSRERSSVLVSKSNDAPRNRLAFNCLDLNGASGTVKMRLPVKDVSSKKRKTGNGGRIFSPSERHLHNTNEQVRRIEMRQSFEELRQLVPNLLDKPRAPKVSILQDAKIYCEDLFKIDMKLQAQVTALRLQQDKLRSNLSHLRKRIAASRY